MLKIEEHEKHIVDLTALLNVEGVDQAKLSTIIQGLRENYSEVNTTFEKHTTDTTANNETMEGLRSANMMLLSKLGTQVTDFSNRGNKDLNANKDTSKPDETLLSIDDIANQLK